MYARSRCAHTIYSCRIAVPKYRPLPLRPFPVGLLDSSFAFRDDLISLAVLLAPHPLNRTDTITFTSDLEMEVTVGPGRYDLGL